MKTTTQPDKNPYHNTSEKIYRWSFYVIHVVIAFAFLIVYQQEKDSLIDVIKEVFKFTKDIYYLYVIPIGLKILGEHAPAIVSAFKGGTLPVTPVTEDIYPRSRRRQSTEGFTHQAKEFIDEKNYF
jgi:hypothetical protein